MRSLGQKASREEMAVNATTAFPPASGVSIDHQRGQLNLNETKIPVETSNFTGDLPPPYTY